MLRALLLAPLAACYSYLPSNMPSVRPNIDAVRVRLTEAGSTAMEGQLGTGVREIDGIVESVGRDTVVMSIRQLYTATRTTLESTGGTARVPRQFISETRVRTFSGPRTVALGIGAAGAVVGIAVASAGGSGGGTIPTPPPGNPP